jgi:hypothetical protein
METTRADQIVWSEREQRAVWPNGKRDPIPTHGIEYSHRKGKTILNRISQWEQEKAW